MSRAYVYTVIEPSYGTTKTTPTLGTDAFHLRLSEQAAWEAEMTPVFFDVAHGGGLTTISEKLADMHECKGSITTLLYPGIQSSIFLGWAMTPVDSGRTVPWTTTDASSVMPIGDLASLTFYHRYEQAGAVVKKQCYTGCKAHDWSLGFTEKERKLVLKVNWQGIKVTGNAVESSSDPTTLCVDPAETDYPTGPWLFSHIATGTGYFKLASNRTQVADLSWSSTHSMDPRTYESKFLQLDRFTGRRSKCDIGLRLKASPDDLASFQGRTALELDTLLDNGTHTLRINFLTTNKIVTLQRDLPDGSEYGRKLSVENLYCAASTNDFSFAQT